MNNINEINNCAICLTELTDSVNTLTCNHSYHNDCINGWFKALEKNKQATTCPLCKRNIVYIKTREPLSNKSLQALGILLTASIAFSFFEQSKNSGYGLILFVFIIVTMEVTASKGFINRFFNN